MNKKGGRDKVVALRYRDDENQAPKVIAKGEGEIAKKNKGNRSKRGHPDTP